MGENALVPNYFTWSHYIGALGASGHLAEMDQALVRMRKTSTVPDIRVIAKMIFHHGRLKDIDGKDDKGGR